MAGIGKKIMGAFFEFEEPQNNISNNENVATSNYTPVNNGAILTSVTNSQNTIQIPQNNSEEISKFRNYFNELLKKLNMEGPDFFEFYQLFNSENMVRISDQNTRLIATFSALSFQGLTKEKLLSSVDHYTNALIKDKETYNNLINDKIKNESLIKTNKIESNKIQISNIDKEIIELSNKKQLIFNENSSLEQSISDDTLNDRGKLSTYENVYSEFILNITNSVNLIKTNL